MCVFWIFGTNARAEQKGVIRFRRTAARNGKAEKVWNPNADSGSNRGDIYQTLIAFDWALTVLSDPGFQWLEIDSTTYLIDDVVIAKSDGSLICCRCKKNQADFRAWSIADLAGELEKAFLALDRNQEAQVRFYSRSEFGALAKLREYSALYGNETDYHANLTKEGLLEHFKDEGLEIVSKEDMDDLKLLKATRNEDSVTFDEYLKNEN